MNDVRKEILLNIQKSYNYSPQEAVSYYLQKVYPDPETMDAEEKAIYSDIKSLLINLLVRQEAD